LFLHCMVATELWRTILQLFGGGMGNAGVGERYVGELEGSEG